MKILLVLAGSIPSRELLKTYMEFSDLIIAVDGGVNAFTDYEFQPDVIVGDLDSARLSVSPESELIKDADQESTDLQKALDYVLNQRTVQKLTILGGLGGRTDHLLNNLKICSQVDPAINLEFHSELSGDSDFENESIYRLAPGEMSIRANSDSTISIISIDPFEGLNSTGLKWELQNEKSASGFISQSNQTVSQDVLFSLLKGIVYIAVYQ